MDNTKTNKSSVKARRKGVFSAFQSRIKRNRLGEILVQDGALSPQDLHYALATSKAAHQPIGKFLRSQHMVSRAALHRAMAEQFMLRLMLAFLTLVISMGAMGFLNKARAGSIKDVPALMKVSNTSFGAMKDHPKLFGSDEKRSGNLSAFTKWAEMFDRLETTLAANSSRAEINQFKSDLAELKDLPLHRMAILVNDMMNDKAYISDSENYGQSDYWATPIEFLANGGDCEDYAIAKYTALRALGVSEDRLRLAIVQDLQKDIPHAVLIVYTDRGAYVLDNQIKSVTNTKRITHYKPIFSINRDAWWLHTTPRDPSTIIAAAQ